MRDALLFLVVFGCLPFVFKRPAFGAIMFAWISLMNPHRLAYGAAKEFPFALLISLCMLPGLLAAGKERSLPKTSVTITLMLFTAWMSLTCLTALEPDLAWQEWTRVMKTFAMVFISIAVIRTEKDLKLLVWVVALSLGFYGLKGGIFTLLSGGTSHVFGPDGSYIGDNNALALALVTVTPLLWFEARHVPQKYLRLGMMGVVVLTVVSAAGSYSRGALLAFGAMLAFLWIKSKTKFRTGIAVLLVVPLIYAVMPPAWFGRMETIDNYQQDDSAMGRLNAWKFAVNVANSHPLGGGYRVFTKPMFLQYAPDPFNHHAAHSIYFQVLGEHGYVGLLLFLLFLFFSWRTGSRIIRICKNRPELKWHADLAAMCQVSLIGYMVAGAFLTLAYYDLPYYVVVILLALERLVAPLARPGPAVAGNLAPKPR